MPTDTVTYDRNTLYEQVWADPVRTVAETYGISDVGLVKICKKLGVPTPGRGYWVKLRYGKTVERLPLPKVWPSPPPACPKSRADRSGQHSLIVGTREHFLVGGETWEAWNGFMIPALLEKANTADDENNGQIWDPDGQWTASGYIGPITYHSMAILSLQACYRYVPREMVPVDE